VSSDHRSSRHRRYLSLVVFATLLVAPLAWAVALAAAMVTITLLRAIRARRSRRAGAQRPADGVRLGVDPSGRPVWVGDRQLAAHALIVGASGAGKSTTLLGILCDQIRRGRPVVVIDMKGSPAFARELAQAAAAAGRQLRVWSPDGPNHWNPLAHGNATALKDKLIATERFTEPHYQRAAERYVQTVLQVLHAAHPGRPAQLDEVVATMEPRRLATMLRDVPRPLADRVQDYLAGLTHDQVSAVRGLGTRLALLSESSAGRYLVPGGGPATGPTIDLQAGLEGGDVVLMSLNSSVYGKLAAQLGALAIQDLVSATGHRLDRSADPAGVAMQATVGIDEFSALGADNVLALLARGRESGVSVLLATQELADLERAAPGFRDQVLGITAVKLAHRQDVPASALTIAQMAGTERVWEETLQMRGLLGGPGASRGSRRQVEQFLVHPNEIKTLQTGQLVMLTKTPIARTTRLRVSPPRHNSPQAGRHGSPQAGRNDPPRAGTSGVGTSGAGTSRGDQAAPGVTR
jgi:conjugal transfer pilus assembly protein TraD